MLDMQRQREKVDRTGVGARYLHGLHHALWHNEPHGDADRVPGSRVSRSAAARHLSAPVPVSLAATPPRAQYISAGLGLASTRQAQGNCCPTSRTQDETHGGPARPPAKPVSLAPRPLPVRPS